MGKKFAPSYANIYMAGFEHSALQSCPSLPQVYSRFLDDIFRVWPHSLDHFLQFINHPTIKVKYTQQDDASSEPPGIEPHSTVRPAAWQAEMALWKRPGPPLTAEALPQFLQSEQSEFTANERSHGPVPHLHSGGAAP